MKEFGIELAEFPEDPLLTQAIDEQKESGFDRPDRLAYFLHKLVVDADVSELSR